jgi:hypothetical protein
MDRTGLVSNIQNTWASERSLHERCAPKPPNSVALALFFIELLPAFPPPAVGFDHPNGAANKPPTTSSFVVVSPPPLVRLRRAFEGDDYIQPAAVKGVRLDAGGIQVAVNGLQVAQIALATEGKTPSTFSAGAMLGRDHRKIRRSAWVQLINSDACGGGTA